MLLKLYSIIKVFIEVFTERKFSKSVISRVGGNKLFGKSYFTLSRCLEILLNDRLPI